MAESPSFKVAWLNIRLPPGVGFAASALRGLYTSAQIASPCLVLRAGKVPRNPHKGKLLEPEQPPT